MPTLIFANRLYNENAFNLLINDIVLELVKKLGLYSSYDETVWDNISEDETYIKVIIAESSEKIGIANRHNTTIYNQVKDFILRELFKDRETVINQIHESIAANKKGTKAVPEIVLDDLTYLINDYDKCAWLNDKTYIKDDLINFRNYISNRFGVESGVLNNPEVKSLSVLKWTAGPAALGTLFHDLLYLWQNDNGDAYLNATVPQVKLFIDNHFRNGLHPFESTTIATYLDKNKPEKKVVASKRVTKPDPDKYI